jgi:hypothetical protein
MQAHNRPLHNWFKLIELGQLTLPRFQRHEVWSHDEVSNLLSSMVRGLPTGAALILAVDGPEQFKGRHLAGTPQCGKKITEQLLDGQQRITAMWKSLFNLYAKRTYMVNIDKKSIDVTKSPATYLASIEVSVFGQAMHIRKGRKYPLWVGWAKHCWERGAIPFHLLRPEDISKEKKEWIKAAEPDNEEMREFLDELITELRERIKHYNLPYLELPSSTPKHVALDVFIKLNTSSVKLTAYDIVVALVEDAAEKSLHELVNDLIEKVPKAQDYAEMPDLVLDTIALLQDIIPSQAGYMTINFEKLVTDWEDLETCFSKMVELLEEEHIYDHRRLPSYTALPVIAALSKYLPTSPDALGNVRHLLKKYLWRSFLTDRYEKASTSNSIMDFRRIRDYVQGIGTYESIPIFDESEYPAPVKEAIQDAIWPKNRTILGRGLIALQIKCGAYDFADGTPATKSSILTREYHHLYPNALLEKSNIPNSKIFSAANCALISWRTNRSISDKNPMKYLLERAENCDLGHEERDRRLRSHLIPVQELNVDYSDFDNPLTKAKIVLDYTRFVEARSMLLEQAAKLAYNGEPLSADHVYAILTDLK